MHHHMRPHLHLNSKVIVIVIIIRTIMVISVINPINSYRCRCRCCSIIVVVVIDVSFSSRIILIGIINVIMIYTWADKLLGWLYLRLPCHCCFRGTIWCADVSPDGREAALGTNNGTVLYHISAGLYKVSAGRTFSSKGSDVLSQVRM